jgi:hypothetical protein
LARPDRLFSVSAALAGGLLIAGPARSEPPAPVAVEPAAQAEPASKPETPVPPPETPKAEPAPDGEKTPEKPPLLPTPRTPPLGAAGPGGVKKPPQVTDDFVPMPDRWRVGLPAWARYRNGQGAPYRRGSWLDPYNQNVLKGDYPILGQRTFLSLGVISETLAELRRRPTPSNVSSAGPNRYTFFGGGQQLLVDQTFFLTAELFHGDTAFRPKDWAFRFTPAFNLDHLDVQETGVVNIDVRRKTSRTDTHIGIQELYGEYKLADLAPRFDFVSVRTGVQGFNSDFRGFLFSDDTAGMRFFGSSAASRNQFNLAYFRPLEKDTYSRLNTLFADRKQDIILANYYRQDLLVPGYTGQLTFAFNDDHGDRHFDQNNRQVRPALLGDARAHKVRTFYLGWNGDGHLGRLNISHSFYQAFGRDTHNPIARRAVDINAQMAAVELSYDKDWLRFRTSFLYASGDSKPQDGRARGFDAIFDNPAFAGGQFSYWQSQAIPLTGTNVELVTEGSFLPTLRSSRLEGQPNFINPGLILVNAGIDADVTPKWKLSANVNWLQFQNTKPLELVLNQSGIHRSIGIDYSLGVRHRPFLNENVVFTAGVSALVPGRGFRDIFQERALFSFFGKLSLAY